MSLKLNLEELNDKEIIKNLVNKVNSLEKQVETNKKDIETLFNEIKELKNLKYTIPKEIINNIDSKIVNDKEIEFIYNYLKQIALFQNKEINFNLLYRGTRDGDDTINLHKKCDKYKMLLYL